MEKDRLMTDRITASTPAEHEVVTIVGGLRRSATWLPGRRTPKVLWQSADACPIWGTWYQTARDARECSNASDRVVRL